MKNTTSDNSGWVLTADRKPTADDADEREYVWVMSDKGKVCPAPYWNVCQGSIADSNCDVWHPKPKAKTPEPYKPPVPERVDGWVNVYREGTGGWFYRTEEQARRNKPYGDRRIAHLREVRDGDPSLEDVAAVRKKIRDNLKYYELDAGIPKQIVAGWLELLGGKP